MKELFCSNFLPFELLDYLQDGNLEEYPHKYQLGQSLKNNSMPSLVFLEVFESISNSIFYQFVIDRSEDDY
jgi:hypothetical protein